MSSPERRTSPPTPPIREKEEFYQVGSSQEMLDMQGVLGMLRSECVLNFTPEPIDRIRLEKYDIHLKELLRKGDYNIVVIGPHPSEGGCGAGHSRQMQIIKKFLEDFQARTCYIELKKVGGILGLAYLILQRHPELYQKVSRFSNLDIGQEIRRKLLTFLKRERHPMLYQLYQILIQLLKRDTDQEGSNKIDIMDWFLEKAMDYSELVSEELNKSLKN